MTPCNEPGCSKGGSFGYLDRKGYWCKQHSKPDMVDRVHQLCRRQGCNKRATFGSEITRKSYSCAVHRRASEVDVTNKRCIVIDCKSQPSHGPNGKRLRCAFHAKETDKHWKTDRQSRLVRVLDKEKPARRKAVRTSESQEVLSSLRSSTAAKRKLSRENSETPAQVGNS